MPGKKFAGKVAMWQKKADEHLEKQMMNPFSDWEGASHRPKLSKDDVNYGKPVEGSMTEYRGMKAAELISSEIMELCHVIVDLGTPHADNTYTVTFGELFEAYLEISNKVVGMLLRARKQKLLYFDGEMLYQGRDEQVVVTLLVLPEED